MQQFHTLRLILGDQLNSSHSWYRHVDNGVLYVIAELHQETSYVKHHIQKITAFFAAMENFASALQSAGHQVNYLTLDDSADYRDLSDLIAKLCEQYGVENFDAISISKAATRARMSCTSSRIVSTRNQVINLVVESPKNR